MKLINLLIQIDNMININIIRSLCLIFLFVGCKSKEIPEKFSGKWNIFHAYHKGKDVLGNDNSNIFMTSLFSIDEKGKFIIDTEENDIFGDISYSKSDKKEVLVISNSNDARFNGKYDIKLNIEKEGRFENFYLKMISENVEIIAEKNNTSFR